LDIIPSSVKLGPSNNLKHLIIRTEALPSFFRQHEGLEWLCRELSDPDNPSGSLHALEAVCFLVRLRTEKDYKELAEYSIDPVYGLLDTTFSNRQCFPKLKEVEVLLSASAFSVKNAEGLRETDTIAEIARKTSASMPCLQDLGLLKVTVDFEAINWAIDLDAWYYNHYD
jgi:hypothetical protein